MRLTLATIIFLFTYAVITGRRMRWLKVDRPTGALLGAVLMVASGVLTPEQAYDCVHHGTIALLIGMMVLNAHLMKAGFFEWAAWQVLHRARSPIMLLHLTVWTAGLLSALLVNDTVCLMLTPLVIALWRGAGLPLLPGLLALSTGANIGSAMTLVGNPQNMIVGQLSSLPFARFALLSLPAGLLGLATDGLLLQVLFRRDLARPHPPPRLAAPPVQQDLLRKSLGVLVGVLVGFLLGFDLAFTALAGAAVLIPLAGQNPRETLAVVDWPLLLFFASLFIVMGGLGAAGAVELAGQVARPLLQGPGLGPALHLSWISLLGSQLVSNVPLVMLIGSWIPQLADPEQLWLVLALTATFAGNLTMLGSVANIIVLEGARGQVNIGFFTWLRYGGIITLVTTGLSLATLLLTLSFRA